MRKEVYDKKKARLIKKFESGKIDETEFASQMSSLAQNFKAEWLTSPDQHRRVRMLRESLKQTEG